MTSTDMLPAAVLRRKAVVYVRQSTQTQVQNNLESQRRQYDLVEEARRRGFSQVEVIDDDLGRSASGMVARPGFDRLVAWLCAGEVGAVLCFDASRLARNGRDWHHLLELCGLVDARVIDLDGVYDPCRPNDRLLLGMKGSISEFELGVLRARMFDAARAKARRGELRISVPIGYVWHREVGLGLDPDARLQEVIRLIFERFRKLGSARQVLLSLAADQIHFPRPSDGKKMVNVDWTPIRYRNVISVLKNPFYAGVYVYGKSEKRTTLVDGRARKSYGHGKPVDQWEVMLRDHHEAYIDWAEFERNQKQLAINAYGKVDGVKSGRGGRALLAGLLTCGRCGRRLSVAYRGHTGQSVYRCDKPNSSFGRPRCFSFGGSRPDEAVGRELLRAVEPLAIEAAVQAERRHMEVQADQRRVLELEVQQARYEAGLAERRYAACDPENRLIAAQLEKSWETALQRVRSCEQRLDAADRARTATPAPDLEGLAEDLSAAWNAPTVTMRTRQQLLRTLVKEIIADVVEETREVVLTIHWRGGQHSQIRMTKPRTGEHGCITTDDALAVMRSMAGRWSDEHIAASLNRMGGVLHADGEADRGAPVDALRASARAALASEEALTDLQVEYARLLGGASKTSGAPEPYESVAREGQPFGTSAVSAAYIDAGHQELVLDTGPPDHVGTELRFLALLCYHEMQAWESGDGAHAMSLLGREMSFLNEHVLRWVPSLCDELSRVATHPFYAVAAQVAAGAPTADRDRIMLIMRTGVSGASHGTVQRDARNEPDLRARRESDSAAASDVT